MPKKNKRDVRIKQADLRRRTNVPAPEIEEIRRELIAQLTPGSFAQARAATTHLKLRERKLNLPAMCAIVVSLVSRQIASLREVLRVLQREGLLWVEALKVSPEALSKRFEAMPAELFAALFDQLVAQSRERLAQQPVSETLVPPALAALQKTYTSVLIADASTLEQLRKTTSELRQQPATVLGGKTLVIVDAFRLVPVASFYEQQASCNEKRFNQRMLEAVPVGGLVVYDVGFFSFELFDQFTDAGKYFVTRIKANTSYRTIEVLAEGARYRDEIIEVGLHRSAPCRHRLRLVSVLWGTTWYRYLTNELDPTRLSAEQVAQLYRTRWRIEDAFAVTKRLLGLAYLWVGGSNGIEIQIYATLIFYSVLIQLCTDVAEALKQPLDRISVEMVFRSLYHYSRAVARDSAIELIPFLCDNAKLFGLVKAERKRHRLRDAQLDEIWRPPIGVSLS